MTPQAQWPYIAFAAMAEPCSKEKIMNIWNAYLAYQYVILLWRNSKIYVSSPEGSSAQNVPSYFRKQTPFLIACLVWTHLPETRKRKDIRHHDKNCLEKVTCPASSAFFSLRMEQISQMCIVGSVHCISIVGKKWSSIHCIGSLHTNH